MCGDGGGGGLFEGFGGGVDVVGGDVGEFLAGFGLEGGEGEGGVEEVLGERFAEGGDLGDGGGGRVGEGGDGGAEGGRVEASCWRRAGVRWESSGE